MTWKRWVIVAVVAVVLLKLCLFTVDETQMAVITTFGRPVATVHDAGIYAKPPWQSRIMFDKRLRTYDPSPSEFLTSDKKNLIVDNYVCWRIADPVRFLSAVGSETGAEMRVHDIVWATVSASIGSLPFDAIVSTNRSAIRTDAMMAGLRTLGLTPVEALRAPVDAAASTSEFGESSAEFGSGADDGTCYGKGDNSTEFGNSANMGEKEV